MIQHINGNGGFLADFTHGMQKAEPTMKNLLKQMLQWILQKDSGLSSLAEKM